MSGQAWIPRFGAADPHPGGTLAAHWLTAPAAINVLALVAFTAALCWRIDQIRRHGGGLQALAMTVAVAALTLAFVVSNNSASHTIDDWIVAGASRLCFYGLLALGVASLIVVFFYPGAKVSRERRAGVEAVPLVAALVGLQVSLTFVPTNMREASLSHWTLTNWGYALFYLIACGYLAYGFSACVRSVRRYLALSGGYLRTALTILIAGLALLAVGAVIQILYVLGNATGVADAGWLLATSRWVEALGVVGFLIGISFPMVHAKWHGLTARRRRRRHAQELLPLWELVTGAVPEVVLPDTGRISPTALLHRRVIEIRDAITQLGPFLPDAFDYATTEVRAAMVRMAAARRTDEGMRSGAVRDVLPAVGDGLEGDAAPLLELSAALAALPEIGEEPEGEDPEGEDPEGEEPEGATG
ncbi:MAB_1171c family putative transporter [Gordonia sp. DT30]|uniref:MAB_1171c family putative transporter n=1 Tax=Gordonia sp. DT30 TaxID=3416546 RepID=UPI003CEE9233